MSTSTDVSLYELDLRCPPMPQTLLEAMELSQSADGPELEQVVDMVQHDPMVVTRLLRIANSAYHGQRGHIESVQRAVIVLGPVSVLGIIMSMSLVEVRASLDATTAAPFLNLVRHSIATAFLSQRLLLRADLSDDEYPSSENLGEVFTAGILHDFGKLILLYNFAEKAAPFYDKTHYSAAALRQQEQDLFGYDHVDTGIYLAQRLNFPERLTKIIGCHHGYEDINDHDPTTRRMIYAVAAGNKASNALGYSFNNPRGWDACTSDPLWAQLAEEQAFGFRSPQEHVALIVDAKVELEGYVDAII